MSTLERGIVKTRKPHNCWGCGVALPVGTKVTSYVNADEGCLDRTYWCKVCIAVMNNMWDGDLEYGIAYGSLLTNDPDEWNRVRQAMELLAEE
jgi:hypothetical protein